MHTPPVLFTALRQRFEPLLSLALHVRDTAPGQAQSWACVAAAMNRLADDEARTPLPEGTDAGLVAACRLATYALVDEVLLAQPPRSDGTWFAHGLQLVRLGRSDGGQAFYGQLAVLVRRARNRDVPGETLPVLHGPAGPATAGVTAGWAGPGSPADLRAGLTDVRAGHEPWPNIREDRATFPGAFPLTPREEPGRESGDRPTPGTGPDLAELAAALGSLVPERAGPENAGAMAGCAFMALCLVYGFRGRLYAPGESVVLQHFLQASARLLDRFRQAGSGDREAPAGHFGQKSRAGFSLRRLARPGPLVLVLLPLILVALWYLVCTTLAGNASLPWRS